MSTRWQIPKGQYAVLEVEYDTGILLDRSGKRITDTMPDLHVFPMLDQAVAFASAQFDQHRFDEYVIINAQGSQIHYRVGQQIDINLHCSDFVLFA